MKGNAFLESNEAHLRILHVIPWLAPRYGGPVVLVPQACVALIDRGHQAEIVTTNLDQDGVLRVPTGLPSTWAGAPVTFHAVSPPRRFVTSWGMLADLRTRITSFDIVHIHCLYRFHGIAAAGAAHAAGVPYVLQAHGSLDPWHRNQKRRAKDLYHALIEDRIIKGARTLLCTSTHEQRSIRNLGYATPTEVIPVGIDARELRVPGTSDILTANGVPRDAQIVAYLGRITAKKGVPLLVDSFRQTADQFPRAHLVVAGPDDDHIGRMLLSRITQTGLERRISFVGALDTPGKRSLLQRSQAFVLPSSDESFGVAVAEAMAVGCPVVVSPEVAIHDVIRSSGAGVVAERQPAAIANAVGAILGSPTRGAAMGEAGRRLVDAQFSWSMVAAQTEELYESIIRDDRMRAEPKWIWPLAEARSPAVRPWSTAVVCPQCRSDVQSEGMSAGWHCARCGWTSAHVDGIPILIAHPDLADHDEIDHGHKAAQASHFDRLAEEQFETNRPHGTPRFYQFLLTEKFRRVISPIRPQIGHSSALIACGGSGLDAEMLARLGADVTTSDLSLGAARRAAKRSARFGIPFASAVADVERLPLPDQSVDVVAVHDGLHHLEDPYAGLAEMARVARRWVLVSEPARAAITRAATHLGLAVDTEAAGNRVIRMEPEEVANFLRSCGYTILKVERYAMYYPHHPGGAFRVLSLPVIFPIVRVCWRVANTIFGRFGNKMAVVAEREA